MQSWSELSDLCLDRIKALLPNRQRLLLGLAGAQGTGKSTFASLLSAELNKYAIPCVVLSLDDFYLTKADRIFLARTVHPLLATRGVPGTHDTTLLLNSLLSLLAGSEERVKWPSFSKKLDDRLSDNHNEFMMDTKTGKQVIILEGWCVGCELLKDINEAVNEL